MKTTITSALAITLLCAVTLSGCRGCGRQPNNPNLPKPAESDTQQSWTISADEADAMVRKTGEELNRQALAPACNPEAPCLKENITQYIFSTQGLAIEPSDTWHFLKAYDEAASAVCMILEVESSSGAKSYYKGVVDCPRLCGITTGGLTPAIASRYLALPLTRLNNEASAEHYLNLPQINCVQDITIYGNQGIEQCKNQGAALVHMVQTIAAGAPASPVLYNLKSSGDVIGKTAYIIPMTQVCIYLHAGDCPLP
jgi:hypothetical protein